jgi:hypothetical protein
MGLLCAGRSHKHTELKVPELFFFFFNIYLGSPISKKKKDKNIEAHRWLLLVGIAVVEVDLDLPYLKRQCRVRVSAGPPRCTRSPCPAIDLLLAQLLFDAQRSFLHR